jgi:uncharacterized protein YceH (UPF0502 family)
MHDASVHQNGDGIVLAFRKTRKSIVEELYQLHLSGGKEEIVQAENNVKAANALKDNLILIRRIHTLEEELAALEQEIEELKAPKPMIVTARVPDKI